MAATKRSKSAKAPKKVLQVPTHGAVTEGYVERIAGMMRRLEWRTGTSGPKLATELKLSDQYVRELAAEASKRVRAEADLTFVKDKCERALEDAIDTARDTGDLASLIRASKELAVVAGTAAPTKTQEVPLLPQSREELCTMLVSIMDAETGPLLLKLALEAKAKGWGR